LSTTLDLYTCRTDNSIRILDALNDPRKYPTTRTRAAVRSPSTLRRDAMLRECSGTGPIMRNGLAGISSRSL
jgi:hypothetical protein